MNKIPTCIALIVFLAAGNLASAQNIYIKATDQNGAPIPGEVATKSYTGDIAASSFGQDNSACAPNGVGVGTCKPTLGHFIFNMTIDKSLLTLNKLLFTGAPMKTIDIIFTRNGGATGPIEFYRVHLELASIVHITNAIDGGGAAPTAQVELVAVRSGWTYTPFNAAGTPGTPVKFGWDTNANAPWTSF